MNISDFRNVAQANDARVYLDTRTDELKVRRQTFLNRAVDWIRGRISPNPLASTEPDAAHNRFLRAIADYSGYVSGDVSRAEALLSTDVLEGRALSSRRVREVIEDLDSRSSQATRDNRTTVAWMSSRGVADALRKHGTELDGAERELVSGRVDESIQNAGGHGRRTVTFMEAAALTDGVVDGFLAQKAAAAEAEARARAEAAARAEAQGQEEPAGRLPAGAAAAPASSPPPMEAGVPSGPHRQAAVGGPPRAAQVDPAKPKELLRMLGKAKLPGKVKAEVRKLVKSGAVSDRTALAKRTNQATAECVRENRIGRWYGQAQKRSGARDRIRDGEMLMAPSRMLDEAARSIRGCDGIAAYPDVKERARSLIAEHVRKETGRTGA